MKRIIAIALIVLCFLVLPASAVILEVTVKGTVQALDKEKNTLTIANPARYGCMYPPDGERVCSYTPMENASLTGTVPVESSFSVFSAGDPVIATSLGGAGGKWITLAKTSGDAVTDIVGDPSSVPAPLAGGYSLDLSTEPDCTRCDGTTCTAASSLVRVQSGGNWVSSEELAPGHALNYNGRNDGSAIGVTFVRGQASSSTCAGRPPGMTGPQAIPVYIVHVVPPIGSVVQAPSATPQLVTMPPAARPTTTRAPLLPGVVAGAVALAAVLRVSQRH